MAKQRSTSYSNTIIIELSIHHTTTLGHAEMVMEAHLSCPPQKLKLNAHVPFSIGGFQQGISPSFDNLLQGLELTGSQAYP